jgi:hypothetical protein
MWHFKGSNFLLTMKMQFIDLTQKNKNIQHINIDKAKLNPFQLWNNSNCFMSPFRIHNSWHQIHYFRSTTLYHIISKEKWLFFFYFNDLYLMLINQRPQSPHCKFTFYVYFMMFSPYMPYKYLHIKDYIN